MTPILALLRYIVGIIHQNLRATTVMALLG